MNISPDNIVMLQFGKISFNATIIYTWITMAVIVIFSWIATRRLTTEVNISRWQNLLEVLVTGMKNQIRSISRQEPDRFLPLIGTLFIFIAVSIVFGIIPGYQPPTGSLSTTAALALCVFIAVPLFGIKEHGIIGYLKQYLQPSPFMLPFNILGEISRTIALAVRLFGNVMSGSVIIAILVSIAPLIFPILMQALGLLTGLIQAYIFAILSTVYIASATSAHVKKEQMSEKSKK
ncbi:MAG: F0F1 ATP synthase subunit A [Candidatus Brocadiaceae bacterium]|nr:F0F1 ATP synthase subunit A [Candidatus Brocadiaceae bacterium]